MKYVPLVAKRDGIDSSQLGWSLANARSNFEGFMTAFGPTTGRLLAHDIIEHQNGAWAIGTVADELEAIGAMYYVRGYNGQLHNRHHTCEDTMATDIHSTFVDSIHYEELYMPRIHRTYSCEDFDPQIDDVFDRARPLLRHEMENNEHVDILRIQNFLERTRHYMRRGYRKARKRFANEGQAGDYFYRVKDAGNRLGNPDYEGQRAYIGYTLYESRCRVIEEPDYGL